MAIFVTRQTDSEARIVHRSPKQGGYSHAVAGGIAEPHPVPSGKCVGEAARPRKGIYEVAVEAYADVPGAEDDETESFEDWLEHDMRGSGDRPDATFVAVAADEVVGYAKFSLTDARPTVAAHDMTGVRRAWRGRGVARALECAQISWAMRSDFEKLETKNDVRNAPIRHLNAELGYRTEPGRILMQGHAQDSDRRLGERPRMYLDRRAER